MVTLQILVLSFLVRIRVSQQQTPSSHELGVFLHIFVSSIFFVHPTPPILIHAGSPFSLSIEPIYLESLHYLREITLPLIYSCITSLTDHTDSLGRGCALMIPLQGRLYDRPVGRQTEFLISWTAIYPAIRHDRLSFIRGFGRPQT